MYSWRQEWRAGALCLALAASSGASLAQVDLIHDAEPNDGPHQAVSLPVPGAKTPVHIIGELHDSDQDSFRLRVDEDLAGRRFDVQLTGRAGALTGLNVLDVSAEEVDGSGRLPAELTSRPQALLKLGNRDGSRPARVEGLLLPPGLYLLGVYHSGGSGAYRVELSEHDTTPVRSLAADNSAERPHSLSTRGRTATWSDVAEAWYGFEVREQDAGQAWTLGFQTPAGIPATLTLMSADTTTLLELESRDGLPQIRQGLMLPAGEYRVRVSQQTPAVQLFSFVAGAPAAADGREVEPNDRQPNSVEFGAAIAGSFEGSDTDLLEFVVDEAGSQVRSDLILQTTNAAAVPELCLLRPAVGLSHCRRGSEGRAVLHDLALAPGTYQVRMHDRKRSDTDWQLQWLETGVFKAGEEAEPNDDARHPVNLHEKGFGRGQFRGRETDHWRFSVTGEPQLWRLQLQGEGLFELSLKSSSGRELKRERAKGRSRLRMDNLYLMPGEYLVAATGTDADYLLRLQPLGAPPVGMELEPNDDLNTAGHLGWEQIHQGTLAETDDADVWRFALAGEERLRLRVEPPVDGGITGVLGAGDEGREISSIRHQNRPGEALDWDVTLPAGDYSVRLSSGKTSDAEYRLQLQRLPIFEAPPPGEQNLDLSLAMDSGSVRAWSPWAQRLGGTLQLHNRADSPRELLLETHLTDARWQLGLAEDRISLAPGERREVAFTISVPPDSWSGNGTRLSVQLGDDQGVAQASATVDVLDQALAVAPHWHWQVPPQLRGGFNAAAQIWGAEPVASPNIDAKRFATLPGLFNGLAEVGRWTGTVLSLAAERAQQEQPTVRLAGDAPVPVQGFLINPTAAWEPQQFLGQFAVELSLDGVQFQQVLEARLLPLPMEQAFVLPAAVPARFARLVPLGSALPELRSSTVRMGEFKAVAAPDWRPPGGPFNLADPAFGGFLVDSEPWLHRGALERDMLEANGKAPGLRLNGAVEASMVLGFHHQRAARLQSLTVLPLADTPEAMRPVAVSLSVSEDSPLGPWREVAQLPLTGAESTHQLAQPVWARYVRLQWQAPEGAQTLQLPDLVALHEASGPSILGEWGFYADAGPLEQERPPTAVEFAEPPNNRDRASAIPLRPGQAAPGSALLDSYAAWYRIAVPADRNRLLLTLNAQPSLEAAPQLWAASGDAVPLLPLPLLGSPTRKVWEAWVEPGANYSLEVVEPPRSVIFSWDTSASVGAYLPAITNALLRYAESIKPGRDEVNLLPFGRSRPLLASWQGQAYPLRQMLAADPQETSSSAAEQALAVAARELAGRPGKKAVLLLTDAATSNDASLWPSLREGRPQVFALKISSEGALGPKPDTEIDRMQSWARVRGGHFDYVTGQGSLVRGFDRAVARLQRPVEFTVEAAFEQVDNPEPASLQLTATNNDASAAGLAAVEIILDASGSMLKRMQGVRRIDVARNALRLTIEEALPEGLPVALRVYGHKEAGSCRTDLEIPLQPLDKAAFLARLDKVEAVNLARTPIADSLAAVAADLKGVSGRKLVVLLTDGEETCDGDPAAAIQALRDGGVDLRLNIVGFALDDESLKREFATLAAAGGGEYLDAGVADELRAAMRQALQTVFVVVDAAGEEVARGEINGEPLSLPPGQYRVRVEAARDHWLPAVTLMPGELKVLPLPALQSGS